MFIVGIVFCVLLYANDVVYVLSYTTKSSPRGQYLRNLRIELLNLRNTIIIARGCRSEAQRFGKTANSGRVQGRSQQRWPCNLRKARSPAGTSPKSPRNQRKYGKSNLASGRAIVPAIP